MGLIDIINSVPLKVASKIVEKTGKSKYALAQICDIAAIIPAMYVTLDAYVQQNDSVMVAGSIFMIYKGCELVYNMQREEETSTPNFAEIKAKETTKRNPVHSVEENKKYFKQWLVSKDAFEKRNAISGLGYIIAGICLGAAAAVCYFGISSDTNVLDESYQTAMKSAVYAGLFSPMCFLSGLSRYFKASK